MLSKDAFKTRPFRIWSICLLLFFIVLAYAVVRVARRHVEPFVSVNFDSQTFYGIPGISIEVSNRMSFIVNCWIEPETLSSGKWVSSSLPSGNLAPLLLRFSLAAHSKGTSRIIKLQSIPRNKGACFIS